MKFLKRLSLKMPECPVTIALLSANFSLYFLTVLLARAGIAHIEDMNRALALVPSQFLQAFASHNWLAMLGMTGTLFTGLFAHEGFAHVFGNMLVLVLFGPKLEERLGWKRFLLLYLVAGMASNLLDLYMAPTAEFAGLGASAAVCGVMAAFAVRFPIGVRSALAALFIAYTVYGAAHADAVRFIGLTFWDHLAGILTGALLAVFLAPATRQGTDTKTAQHA